MEILERQSMWSNLEVFVEDKFKLYLIKKIRVRIEIKKSRK